MPSRERVSEIEPTRPRRRTAEGPKRSHPRKPTRELKAEAIASAGNGAEPHTAVKPDVHTSDEDVRTRAYYLWLDKPDEFRDPVANWLAAERQLRG